jgi:hypothetical protein
MLSQVEDGSRLDRGWRRKIAAMRFFSEIVSESMAKCCRICGTAASDQGACGSDPVRVAGHYGLLALILHARLPMFLCCLILILHVVLNGIAWLRLRQGGAALTEVALQLAVDAACIGALVFLTGGYANPFISLLLVPSDPGGGDLAAVSCLGMALWVGGFIPL